MRAKANPLQSAYFSVNPYGIIATGAIPRYSNTFERISPFTERKTLLAAWVKKGPRKAFVSLAFSLFKLIVRRYGKVKITVILKSNRPLYLK